MKMDHRANLVSIYQAALAAVDGQRCVIDWLQQQPHEDFRYIVAIGKAAGAMAAGAHAVLSGHIEAGLVISRDSQIDEALLVDSRWQVLAAGHPLPDQRSLDAGAALLAFLDKIAAPVLFLISGGSSAMVESPLGTVSLDDLQRINNWLLSSGLPIQTMNAVRSSLSDIKGGGLARHVYDRRSTVLLISDVIGDNPAVIGSGLLYPSNGNISGGITAATLAGLPDWVREKVNAAEPAVRSQADTLEQPLRHHIIANADRSRRAACEQAARLGYSFKEHSHFIAGDIHQAADEILASLLAADSSVLHVWSGEPTVKLPLNPGRGGRCQALALEVALAIQQEHGVRFRSAQQDWFFLAAGTDGCDGTGEAAGAVVDGGSLGRMASAGLDPVSCLEQANSGYCLDGAGDLLPATSTGTNVMDIFLGLQLA